MNDDLNFSERVELAKQRNQLAFERTRLSAERTVSSWIRTGLASAGGGFAIIRLLVFQNVSHRVLANIIGEILIVWGILIMIFALFDFRNSSKKFESIGSNKRNEWWITITMFIFILVSLFLLIVTLT